MVKVTFEAEGWVVAIIVVAIAICRVAKAWSPIKRN